ncbi:MAG: hypothetical protein RIR51_1312 [Bacteroidota bacterium]|jgi:8-oxo-dGTP pyrophosphatase MutT (NUDIX family)
MIIFIDDKPIRIFGIKDKNNVIQEEDFQSIIDARLGPIKATEFKGNTLIINFNKDLVEKLFNSLHGELTKNFTSLYILVDDINLVKKEIFNFYELVKAAGGIVQNDLGQSLFIYRLTKWDIPKGKMEKGETSRICAVREIKEECNVDVEILSKICTTYHTYSMKGKRVLKRTKWYYMKGNNENLIPQKEEGIEKVEWKNPEDFQEVMKNTFSSIRYVIQMAYVNQSKSSNL